MPLWAAIIASSSLPFYHKFFEGRKEWTATDKIHFLNFLCWISSGQSQIPQTGLLIIPQQI